ncbi:MAG: hypothetical protein LUE27_06890 [Clostridia bacterium]|nr:hypothetical protein [Clostridia bacterium]
MTNEAKWTAECFDMDEKDIRGWAKLAQEGNYGKRAKANKRYELEMQISSTVQNRILAEARAAYAAMAPEQKEDKNLAMDAIDRIRTRILKRSKQLYRLVGELFA